ncbi:response regulator [Pedobacter nutrimenti]|jgi:DNA-binding response OmpR family regulator|uniref:Response regulator receiver domain-containing protein n=1 Tax=Pedobacter nutrimenti TaxID=1241337 RepID=A0A318UQ83_9SPHI|nr:response regulator [Pedobacter nutrimenti]PYF77238.1 response regulator receiver domain-containing protein [Pedobacter nutrimenti]
MNKKILIFDDDQQVLNALSDVLDYADWDLVLVSRGLHALEVIEKEQPNLILMDILMGDSDGRVICKNIKTNAALRHIPVILISGSPELADTLKQEHAPDDIVAKPFNIGDLVDKVYFQLELQ